MSKKIIRISVDYDIGHYVSEFKELGLKVTSNKDEAKGRYLETINTYYDSYYIASDEKISEGIIDYVQDVTSGQNFYILESFIIDDGGYLIADDAISGVYIPDFKNKEVIESIILDLVSRDEIFKGFTICNDIYIRKQVITDLKGLNYKVLETEKVERIKGGI